MPIVIHPVHFLPTQQEQAKKSGVSHVVPKSEFNIVAVVRELLKSRVNQNEEADSNQKGGVAKAS